MKFDRQLRPATETSWLVSYGGKTIPRWRTAAILKIVISPYLSEKSPDFDEILYTAADFELDERHVIKKWKSCIGQTPSSTERISCSIITLTSNLPVCTFRFCFVVFGVTSRLAVIHTIYGWPWLCTARDCALGRSRAVHSHGQQWLLIALLKAQDKQQ